jgi:hypothetical protein
MSFDADAGSRDVNVPKGSFTPAWWSAQVNGEGHDYRLSLMDFSLRFKQRCDVIRSFDGLGPDWESFIGRC